MKILIALLLFNSSLFLFSQSRQVLSGALSTGVFLPPEHFMLDAATGFNFGLELEARNNKFGVYFNGTYNLGKQSSSADIFIYNPQRKREFVHVLEMIIGPRWYIGNLTKINGAIEFGLGYYKYGIGGVNSEGSIGINIGAGINYPLIKVLDLNLKGKYHLLPKDYVTPYGTVNLGIRYSFNK